MTSQAAAWQGRAAEDKIVRPAAILGAAELATVVATLTDKDISRGGVWSVGPGLWQRFAGAWTGATSTPLLGSIGVSYDTPSRHMATIYRVAITDAGREAGYTAESLADEALMSCGLSLMRLPRAQMPDIPARDPFKRPAG